MISLKKCISLRNLKKYSLQIDKKYASKNKNLELLGAFFLNKN